jgi:hypothetical protein
MAYRAYRKYIPRADGAAPAWSRPFAAGLAAAPASFGVDAATAEAISAAVADFAAALARSTAPDTRTAAAVAAKNLSRAAMEKLIRPAVRTLQAMPMSAVSDPARESLGLPVHARRPTTAPLPPDTAPDLHVAAIYRRAHTLRLADSATPTRKARPPGTVGAEIYYLLSPAPQTTPPDEKQKSAAALPAPSSALPPDNLQRWRFAGIATRDTFLLQTPNVSPGQRLTITARWITRRGETGPRGNPITATVAA